jgi:hypothetical protein
MSVIDDIQSLQDRLDQLLDDLPVGQEQATEAAVQAVLRLLDDRDLASLGPARLDELIREALRPAAQQLTTSTQELVTSRVQTLISETQAFYAGAGVTVPDALSDAVRKRETTQRVTEALQSGMQIASQKLKENTLEAVEEELASPGSPSRDAIQEQLEDSIDTASNTAETHARTSIRAYDQEYRDELATETGLTHFLYSGNLQSNSRRFCIAHVGGVYTSDQIDRMRNGQLEPVRTFCGGYNCRHSWVPVDPEWDDDLQEQQVPDDTDPISFGQGDRTATIIPSSPTS